MQQDKTKPIHGLEKLPDSFLLKNSQRELGEYKSYCEELEDKVRDLEAKLAEKNQYYELSEEEKREVSQRMRESEIHQALKEQIKSLNLKVKGLKVTNRQLINRVVELQRIEEPSKRKEYLLCAAIRRVEPRERGPESILGTIPRHLQNRIGLETSRYNAHRDLERKYHAIRMTKAFILPKDVS